MMNQTLQQLKVQLKAKTIRTGTNAVLDPQSKDYQKILDEFLPKIQKMLSDAQKNLEEISTNALGLEKNLNNTNDIIASQRTEVTNILNTIRDYNTNINMWQIDRDKYIRAMNEYDDIIKKMELNWLIPIAGPFILLSDKKSGKYDRYKAEREDVINRRRQLDDNIANAQEQLKRSQEICNAINRRIDEAEKTLVILHRKISNSVNQVLYLTILEERLNLLSTSGYTNSEVLRLLDKEPDDIHFDDDRYMNIIKEYNEHPNSFKDYIVKKAKEFL